MLAQRKTALSRRAHTGQFATSGRCARRRGCARRSDRPSPAHLNRLRHHGRRSVSVASWVRNTAAAQPGGRTLTDRAAYAPVINELGYDPIRADQDVGALIITQMIERLYFADLVLAEMTIPNGNVYYEVGVRHAAREKGCVLLAADWSKQLFDVAQMRTIRYPLADGEVGEAAAQAIRAAIKPKIEALAKGGSPVFESITWISLVSSYSTTTTKFATSSADEVLTADIRIAVSQANFPIAPPARPNLVECQQGLGERHTHITAWLDENCGADGWAMTPSGTVRCCIPRGSAQVKPSGGGNGETKSGGPPQPASIGDHRLGPRYSAPSFSSCARIVTSRRSRILTI